MILTKQKISLTLILFISIFFSLSALSVKPVDAASADVQCKNIKNANGNTDKKDCEEYVKSYNLCDNKKSEDAKKRCRDDAYKDYLNNVCGKSDDNANIKCREKGLGIRFIADIRNGGGNFCPSLGEVKDGCSCQSGETPKNVSTVGQPPKLMCVRVDGGGDGSDGSDAGSLYPTAKDYGLKDNPIIVWVNRVINFLAGLVGIGAVIMIIFAGIQYITARDNPQSVQAAKTKIINVVIGLVAFAFLFAFMQWLIPGGVF